MIEDGRLKCDGCGEPGPAPDGPRPDREDLEWLARNRRWLIVDGRHYCLRCQLAIGRDPSAPGAKP